jgi:hypothetical protein
MEEVMVLSSGGERDRTLGLKRAGHAGIA